jgi:hypothetical protein
MHERQHPTYLVIRHVCASDIGILYDLIKVADEFIRLEELPHCAVEESARHGGRLPQQASSGR